MKKLMILAIVTVLLVLSGCNSQRPIVGCSEEFSKDFRNVIAMIERDLKNDDIGPDWLLRGSEGGAFFNKYMENYFAGELSEKELDLYYDLLVTFKLVTFDETREENLKLFSMEIEKIKKIIK